MININLDDKIFHGLAGEIPFWRFEEFVEESLIQLSKIFTYNGIYSKNILKQLGIEYPDKKIMYNGEDYISVCLKHFSDTEVYQNGAILEPAYFMYVRYKISLVLDPSLAKNFRIGNYKKLPGERQIKDKIDISYIKAICIGEDNLKDQLIIYNKIKNLLSKLKLEIPIVDIDGNFIKNKIDENNLKKVI